MEKAAPKVKEASMAKDNPDREARLAEALRANLRRRKAQSRAPDPREEALRDNEASAVAEPPPADPIAAPSRS